MTVVLAVIVSASSTAAIFDKQTVTETTLDNGLHVIVNNVPDGNLVAAGFCIKASPLYEPADKHGIAEVVRHILFDVPGAQEHSIGLQVEDLGGTFSSFTSPDATQLRLVVTPRALDEIFPKFVRSVFEGKFSERVWAQQMPNLRRQLRQSQQQAVNKLDRIMWSSAFRKHPYGQQVAPSADEVAQFNSKDLNSFYQRLYAPNNAALIFSGNITADRAFALARSHLGKYPRQELGLPQVPQEPVQTQVRTRLAKAQTSKTIISYGWRTTGIDKKHDVCALDLIYAILGEAETGWLNRQLDANDQKQALAKVEFITKRDPGLFKITCVTDPDAEFEVRQIIVDTVKKFRKQGVSAKQLADAKTIIRSGYAFDNATYISQVGSMAFYEVIDSYKFAIDYLGCVDKITAEDVVDVARRYLDPSRYSLVIIRPEASKGRVWEANAAQ